MKTTSALTALALASTAWAHTSITWYNGLNCRGSRLGESTLDTFNLCYSVPDFAPGPPPSATITSDVVHEDECEYCCISQVIIYLTRAPSHCLFRGRRLSG